MHSVKNRPAPALNSKHHRAPRYRRYIDLLCALVGAVLLIFAGTASAQTQWNSSSSGLWSTATNWTNGVPSTGPQLAIFGELTVSPTQVTVQHSLDLAGTLRNATGLRFDLFAGGSGYTFGSTSANTDGCCGGGSGVGIQLRATNISGTGASVLNNDDNVQTFNVPMKMFTSTGGSGSTAAQTWLASAGGLVFTGTYLVPGKATIDNNGGTLTIDGAFDTSIGTTGRGDIVGSGGLTKSGTGTLNLGGSVPNSYTGTTTVNTGTVNAGKANSLGTGLLTMNGGTLNLNGAAESINRISGSAGTINMAAGHTLTVTPTASATYSGVLAGPGSFTKSGSSTQVLSGNNTYDGVTNITAGKLQAGSATALGTTTGNTIVASAAELLFDGATSNFTTAEPIQVAGPGAGDGGAITVQNSAIVTLSGPISLLGDTTLTVSGTGTVAYTNTITSTADQSLTLQGGAPSTGNGGTISGNVSLGLGGLTKLQGGRWTLGGTNSYGGATTVSAGTLFVTGSITGTSGVTVAAATLAGSGTITPASGGGISLSASGKLSPGPNVANLTTSLSGGGTLSLAGGVAATGSAALVFELDTPGASDKVTVTGGPVDIGTAVLEFDDFNFTALGGFGQGTYTLFAGDTAIAGTLGAVIDGTVGGLPAQIQLADSNTDLVLSVVPEPGSAALLMGGMAFLAAHRRKRR